MTKQELLDLGFKDHNHFTVLGSVYYELGNFRQLSASSVGDCNETLWLCEIDSKNPLEIIEVINIHNYDYDGPLELDKVQQLINLLAR